MLGIATAIAPQRVHEECRHRFSIFMRHRVVKATRCSDALTKPVGAPVHAREKACGDTYERNYSESYFHRRIGS